MSDTDGKKPLGLRGTPGQVKHGGHDPGQDTDAVLASMGFAEQEIAGLKNAGAIV